MKKKVLFKPKKVLFKPKKKVLFKPKKNYSNFWLIVLIGFSFGLAIKIVFYTMVFFINKMRFFFAKMMLFLPALKRTDEILAFSINH